MLEWSGLRIIRVLSLNMIRLDRVVRIIRVLSFDMIRFRSRLVSLLICLVTLNVQSGVVILNVRITLLWNNLSDFYSWVSIQVN